MSASPIPPETASHLPAQLRGGDYDAISRLLLIKLPGEPGWEEHQYEMTKRRAARLSENGWKFWKAEGPRGTYYEGFGPLGRRVMSDQKTEPRAAFLAAINHAFDVQFPTP